MVVLKANFLVVEEFESKKGAQLYAVRLLIDNQSYMFFTTEEEHGKFKALKNSAEVDCEFRVRQTKDERGYQVPSLRLVRLVSSK